MANIKKSSTHQEFEMIVPSSSWTEDSTFHYLIIDLHGFKKNDMKLQLVNGQIVATGARQVSQNQHIRFEETFKLPENSNVEKISGKFEDGILYVIIPKQITEEREDNNEISSAYEKDQKHKEPKQDKSNEEKMEQEHEHEEPKQDKDADANKMMEQEEEVFHEANMQEWRHQTGLLLESVMKKISKNRRTIVTVVLAFSLGLWVSQKLHSRGQREAFG